MLKYLFETNNFKNYLKDNYLYDLDQTILDLNKKDKKILALLKKDMVNSKILGIKKELNYLQTLYEELYTEDLTVRQVLKE